MGLKLNDCTLFFTELIGGMSQADLVKTEKINDFYRGLVVTNVKTIISDIIISKGISALEIAPRLEEISDSVKEKIGEKFSTYGFRLVNFYVQSINFPDEDFDKINKILENRAEFEIMGDARYAQKRSFDVYEKAADNQNGVAGTFMSGGLGLGMGIGMAQNTPQPVNTTASETDFCPNCHASIPKGSKFCTSCGKPISGGKKCPSCGADLLENSKFCPNCGKNVAEKICECGTKLDANAKFCHVCGKAVEQL
jgi:membrane protease subunit (stomatin/prohibitin family)